MVRLKTAQDVRRFLARVANELYQGNIEPKTANAITLTCNGILNSLRADEMQQQIDELYQLVDEGETTIKL